MTFTYVMPQAPTDLLVPSGRCATSGISPTQVETALVGTVETDQSSDSAAYTQTLDGSERKLLLAWIAATHPAVVDSGARWLAGYHAANAERRRTVRNRKAKDRRRLRRAESRSRT